MGLQVLLGHPGGPYWARKDEGAWTIPKGEYAAEEDGPGWRTVLVVVVLVILVFVVLGDHLRHQDAANAARHQPIVHGGAGQAIGEFVHQGAKVLQGSADIGVDKVQAAHMHININTMT